MLLAFGLFLTIGIIGEQSRSDKWKRHIRKFEILVLIGVAGELIADGGIFVFSERLQKLEGAAIEDLGRKSKQAFDESNAASTVAKVADGTAGSAVAKSDKAGEAASDALSLARGARRALARVNRLAEDLKTDLLKQGPRAALLQDPERRQRLVNSLLPFAGQKFTVNKCALPTDTDAIRVASLLGLILQNEAKWSNTMPNSFSDQPSCASLGIIINVKPDASPATHKSGTALASALREMLFTTVTFDDSGKLVLTSLSVYSPFDTETVLITVCEHPYDTSGPKTNGQPSKTKR